MKPTIFRVADDCGNVYRWKFERLERVFTTQGPARMNGWQLTTHDGVDRFFQGNFMEFVPWVRLIADNYGVKTTIS